MSDMDKVISELQSISLRLSNLESSISSILNHHLQSSNSVNVITDQIRSLSGSSDQIRSDQISNICSNGFEKFRDHALTLGIDLSDLDLSGIARNIDWYLINSNKIISKANYIKKMVSGLPQKRKVGFTVPITEEPPDDLQKCMGFDVALINRLMPYMDERTYYQTREKIPSWKSLFSSWDECSGNQFKIRMLTCYALKSGILTDE